MYTNNRPASVPVTYNFLTLIAFELFLFNYTNKPLLTSKITQFPLYKHFQLSHINHLLMMLTPTINLTQDFLSFDILSNMFRYSCTIIPSYISIYLYVQCNIEKLSFN